MNCRVDAFILALSQHYRLLKEVIWDGKGKLNLIPDVDANIIDGITDLIKSVGGEGLANYCKLKFQEAWFSYNIKVYEPRAILEYIVANGTPGPFVDYVKDNIDRLVHIVYRLSNPILDKHRTKAPKMRNKPRSDGAEQMLLFPEGEIKADSPDIIEQKDTVEEHIKPVKLNKPRKTRRPRRQRIDKLADEIIDAENGNSKNTSDNDDYDDQDDHDEGFSDACDHYSRGYSRMSDGDFGYFSGQEYN